MPPVVVEEVEAPGLSYLLKPLRTERSVNAEAPADDETDAADQ